MNAKHTPGPWTIFSARANVALGSPVESEIRSADRHVVARLGVIRDWQQGDAALIAAAPELLDALRELANAHSYDSPIKLRKAAYLQARAAIAKATGG